MDELMDSLQLDEFEDYFPNDLFDDWESVMETDQYEWSGVELDF